MCTSHHFDGKSISYESYFIGWDKHGNEVCASDPGHGRLVIIDFRTTFDDPLYLIETDAELLAWKWSWGSLAAVPVAMAKKHFPLLFLKDHPVVADLLIKKKSSARYRGSKRKAA
jgi:hypothetical protein